MYKDMRVMNEKATRALLGRNVPGRGKNKSMGQDAGVCLVTEE